MSVSMYRANIERLTKQKADLEKKVSRESEKIARLRSDISRISRSITTSTSLSMLQSKQRQIDSKEKEIANAQKRAGDLSAQISGKLAELNRSVSNLARAEDQERRKEGSQAKKRRDEELRHAREVTRETERQARLHSDLRRSPLIIDLAKLPPKIKVLFLAANPLDQTRMRLDEEIRCITETVRASEYRDSVELISKWAVRPQDLLQALNEHTPHVVHFSGHGSDMGDIVLQDAEGNAKLVTKEAIVATMRTMADNIRVVVFNTCFSSGQAEAVTEQVDVAIGMSTAIGDQAARVFAARLYSAIGFGRSVKQAFDQASAALMLEGIPEEGTPMLLTRQGIDPNEVVLVRPPRVVQIGVRS